MTGNSVNGAAVVLNAGGAGTSAAPFAVYANSLQASTAGVELLCKKTYESIMNISPDSVVDRRGETFPVTDYDIEGCP